jgi:hypothetical protein
MTKSHSDLVDDIRRDKEKIKELQLKLSGLEMFVELSGMTLPTSYTTWVDPPSGWKYGFPKALPDPAPEDIGEWLILQGYPAKDAHEVTRYIRWWREPNMGYRSDIGI